MFSDYRGGLTAWIKGIYIPTPKKLHFICFINAFPSIILTRSPSSWLMWFIFPSSWTINVHHRGQITPPCPLGGVFYGHNHVHTLRYIPTTNPTKKNSEKMTFNLSKKNTLNFGLIRRIAHVVLLRNIDC